MVVINKNPVPFSSHNRLNETDKSPSPRSRASARSVIPYYFKTLKDSFLLIPPCFIFPKPSIVFLILHIAIFFTPIYFLCVLFSNILFKTGSVYVVGFGFVIPTFIFLCCLAFGLLLSYYYKEVDSKPSFMSFCYIICFSYTYLPFYLILNSILGPLSNNSFTLSLISTLFSTSVFITASFYQNNAISTFYSSFDALDLFKSIVLYIVINALVIVAGSRITSELVQRSNILRVKD